uniref:Uncharacterized protein n=1 Tax=Amphiprion percula TaxID=161767 RepID=A0A3P8S7A3_AMPPE
MTVLFRATSTANLASTCFPSQKSPNFSVLLPSDDDLIKPRKLPNPILASHQHRALHQELLFCHRRGVLPRRKPELQCVLEHKQREQRKQREVAIHPPSDLEVKLRTRLQRLQYELEEQKRSESLKNVPEFVFVRQTLNRTEADFQFKS